MFRIITDFKTYPPGVQKGIVLLLVSWIWFYTALGGIAGIEIPPRMLMVGVCILLLAGSMKNWARLLCLMGNGMAILFCVFYAIDVYRVSQGGRGAISTTLIFSALLFLVPTYYLSIKTSSEFYKAYNHTPEEQEK